MAKSVPQPPDKARCIFYWPRESVPDIIFKGVSNLHFSLNGSEYAPCGHSLSYDDLLAGSYEMALSKRGLFGDKPLMTLTVEPGKVYYIRFDGARKAAIVDKQTALEELKKLKYHPPKPVRARLLPDWMG